MSDRLAVHGASAEEVPTIAVEPPRSPTQMERAVKGLVDGRYQWVVFTSTNAVRAVWEKFAEFGLDARAFSGVKIACVGPATAEKVREFGIVPDLVPTETEPAETSSEGLLSIFPPHDDILDPVDRVLLPRADIATETLAAGLREGGWEIDDVTAYRTVRAAPPPAPIREAIKSGGFDAVCFTSSSTVRNLVGIAGKPHARTIVACIGPQTAETAREFGLRVDVQPEEARVPALVDALAAHAVAAAGRGRAASAPQGEGPPPLTPPLRGRTTLCAENVAIAAFSAHGPTVVGSRCGVSYSAAPAAALHSGTATHGRRDRPGTAPTRPADVRQGGHRRAGAGDVHARRRPAHP